MFFPCRGITHSKMYLWKLFFVSEKAVFRQCWRQAKSCQNKKNNFVGNYFAFIFFLIFQREGEKGRRCLIKIQLDSINLCIIFPEPMNFRNARHFSETMERIKSFIRLSDLFDHIQHFDALEYVNRKSFVIQIQFSWWSPFNIKGRHS